MPHFLQQPHSKKCKKSYFYCIFIAFCSILTDFPLTQRIKIWYGDNTLGLVCPCEISHQCSYFCRSHVQKSTKKCIFTAFCSILTDFELRQRLEIWYVDNTHALVCPCIIPSKCSYFCGSHVQKSTKNAFLQHFAAYRRTSR